MNRKILVVTGTRAEYGLLRWLMQGIKDDSELILQVIVTGMHLSSTFGFTYKEIESDGFRINKKIEIIGDSDANTDISKSIAKGIVGFANAFEKLAPDLIIVLGDRFEILSAAISAHVARIPIAHIHGGESTEGILDEAFRHSITKMSQLHFAAANEYKNRIIQLGENPSKVFMVGGLGVDSLKKINLISRSELEKKLNLKLNKYNLLVTFHPVTLEIATAREQMNELLNSLSKLQETTLIFTLPNADSGGRLLIEMVEEFVRLHTNAYSYKSLGQILYLSCLSIVDGVVGNSSSGLTEAPSFKKGTINIGDRQSGRLQATSVINCKPYETDILEALKILYSDKFRAGLRETINPYGEGGASIKILEVIKSIELSSLIKKKFYDIGNI